MVLPDGVQQLVDLLEAAVAPPSPSERRYYGWQPLPLVDFYRGLNVIGPGNGRRFLDVGSGIGSKLFLASWCGFDVHGVELRLPYVECSCQLFPRIEVTHVDAFAFDRYHEFDVVYSYRPCVNPATQDWLNREIAAVMKPGAVFFSAGGPYPDWLEPLGNQVWRR